MQESRSSGCFCALLRGSHCFCCRPEVATQMDAALNLSIKSWVLVYIYLNIDPKSCQFCTWRCWAHGGMEIVSKNVDEVLFPGCWCGRKLERPLKHRSKSVLQPKICVQLFSWCVLRVLVETNLMLDCVTFQFLTIVRVCCLLFVAGLPCLFTWKTQLVSWIEM